MKPAYAHHLLWSYAGVILGLAVIIARYEDVSWIPAILIGCVGIAGVTIASLCLRYLLCMVAVWFEGLRWSAERRREERLGRAVRLDEKDLIR